MAFWDRPLQDVSNDVKSIVEVSMASINGNLQNNLIPFVINSLDAFVDRTLGKADKFIDRQLSKVNIGGNGK